MKKKEVNINEESTSAGGAHAVNKFRISDFVMMAVIVILCASCVLPFLHVAVKSISGNTAVMSKSVYFWPKDITFDAYKKVFADNSMTYSMIFSVIVTVLLIPGSVMCHILFQRFAPSIMAASYNSPLIPVIAAR